MPTIQEIEAALEGTGFMLIRREEYDRLTKPRFSKYTPPTDAQRAEFLAEVNDACQRAIAAVEKSGEPATFKSLRDAQMKARAKEGDSYGV